VAGADRGGGIHVNYPGTSITTLGRDTSDHMSCLVSISTDIPKAKIFRFENY
jgi:hypothetical protein